MPIENGEFNPSFLPTLMRLPPEIHSKSGFLSNAGRLDRVLVLRDASRADRWIPR